MRRLFLVTCALLLAGSLAGCKKNSHSSANLNGTWAVAQPAAGGVVLHNYFVLHQKGNTVTGRMFFRGWGDIPLSTSTWKNDSAVFPMRQGGQMTIRRSGQNLEIAMTGGRMQRSFTATPAPASMVMPPAPLPLPALKTVPSNGLATTPPMGWNSWNHFEGKIDDQIVRQIADAMVSSGMKAAGYEYINIDDTWEGGRDAQGNIVPNSKFPNMKALADYVHSKGLKLGIYSSPGPYTCAGYAGSYGHEVQDAKTYASWGIDYLKYDWCSAGWIYPDSDLRPVYQKMGEALEHSGRHIVFSLCEYGRGDVWTWGPKVGGNLWRTTGDINDSWKRMTQIGFHQSHLAPYAAPGHWNDPDMLEVGNGHMSDTEYRTHFSLWSMLAAPLIAGNDLRHMTPQIRAILTNREVIAIDQDRLGKQGQRIEQNGSTEVWTRPLAGGAMAIALFNRGDATAPVSVTWKQAGIQPRHLRDLWAHKAVKASAGGYSAQVPAHGVVLLRASR